MEAGEGGVQGYRDLAWAVSGLYSQSHPRSPWGAQPEGCRSDGCPGAAAAPAPAGAAAPPPACSWPRSAAAGAGSRPWGRAAHRRPGREEAQEKDILAAGAWDQTLVSDGMAATNGWASQNVCSHGQYRPRASHLPCQTMGH